MGRPKRQVPKYKALDALNKGEIGKARDILEGLLANTPPDPEVMNNLAAVYEKLKVDVSKPLGLLEKANQLFPTHAVVKANLIRLSFNSAISLVQNKNFPGAITLLEKTLQFDPLNCLAHLEIGNCLHMIGELEKAVVHFTRAVNLDPKLVGGYTGLGLSFMEMGKLAEAKGAFQQVLALEPKKVSGYVHLGLLANRAGLTGVAVNMMQRALELDPNNSAALNNLGLVLRDQGEIAAAFEYYSKAKELYPSHPEIASGFLLTLNYLPEIQAEVVAQEHRRIDQVYDVEPRIIQVRDPNPRRKLHIGYLSPDFLFHSVAYFMVGLLKEHNRDEVEISCYFTGKACDQLTEQIKANSDHFFACYRWPNDRLAHQIQQDRIDVLVELTGHTRDHRLAMMRNRVTPIQVTYLGYPNTTGLSSMDLRITDSIADPPGVNDHLYSETLVRIEGGFLSYTPPKNAWKLDVGPLPALSKPGISFGSFNNLAKVNNQVLEVWAEILNRLPQATLIIKARGMRDERVLSRLRKHLYSANIAEARVALKSYELFYEEHMSCYREIDLALDTFPYTGTTTTCEALWMGVPVLTLAGDRHAGRVGESILTRIGMEEFISRNPEDYVERAVRWASDLPRLAALRSGMRERMQASPLMDHRRMAQGLESAYRTAWEKYCKSMTP